MRRVRFSRARARGVVCLHRRLARLCFGLTERQSEWAGLALRRHAAAGAEAERAARDSVERTGENVVRERAARFLCDRAPARSLCDSARGRKLSDHYLSE